MTILNNFSILEEFNKPYMSTKDYIVHDIMTYSSRDVMVTYVYLVSDRKLLSISEFTDYIEEKKLLKWRSDNVRDVMIAYYESIEVRLKKYSRDEKINKITNPELYNINNLCLAC